MVDLSLQVPGVLGAQLSCAGLGGCIMVLVRSEAKEQAKQVLTERFYVPRPVFRTLGRHKFGFFPC